MQKPITLALPAPSAARTRTRNREARLQKLRTLKWTIVIHDAPSPKVRAWTVVTKWVCPFGEGDVITTTLTAATTRQDAIILHREAAVKNNPGLYYKTPKTIVACALGTV